MVRLLLQPLITIRRRRHRRRFPRPSRLPARRCPGMAAVAGKRKRRRRWTGRACHRSFTARSFEAACGCRYVMHCRCWRISVYLSLHAFCTIVPYLIDSAFYFSRKNRPRSILRWKSSRDFVVEIFPIVKKVPLSVPTSPGSSIATPCDFPRSSARP